FLFEEAQQQLLRPRVDLPVEIPEVVTGRVATVVGKLDTARNLAGLALGAQLPGEDLLRDDVEVFDLVEERFVEEPAGLRVCRLDFGHLYVQGLVSGVFLMISDRISSV